MTEVFAPCPGRYFIPASAEDVTVNGTVIPASLTPCAAVVDDNGNVTVAAEGLSLGGNGYAA